VLTAAAPAHLGFGMRLRLRFQARRLKNGLLLLLGLRISSEVQLPCRSHRPLHCY
jgi:hypothetical protein